MDKIDRIADITAAAIVATGVGYMLALLLAVLA